MTCVICGKKFEATNYPFAKTCSPKCRGIYWKQTGIAQEASKKAHETVKAKLDSGKMAVQYKKKICAYCGKEFELQSSRQIYCDGPHYRICEICGKQFEIKSVDSPTTTCSKDCRLKKIRRTTNQRYGSDFIFQTDEFKEKSKSTLQQKYGVDHYSKTEDYREKFESTMQERYGVTFPLQSKEIQAKMNATNVDKYGVPWVMMNPAVKEKSRLTQEASGGIGLSNPENQENFKKASLTRYGVDNPLKNIAVREKIQETNLERYGVANPIQSPEIQEKIRQTNLERYGVKYTLQADSVKSKIEQTNLQKYGVTNVFQSEEIKSKIRESLMKSYGVDNPQKSKEIRQKTQATNLEKYGAEHWRGSEQGIKSTMQDPTKYAKFVEFRANPESYIKEHYNGKVSLRSLSFDLGVDVSTVSLYVLNAECTYLIDYVKSYAEVEIFDFLKSLDKDIRIIRNCRSMISPKELDLYLPDYNLAIGCNPTYTHNSSKSTHFSNFVLPPSYHRQKTLACMEKGIRLIHIFGHEWTNKQDIVKSMLAYALNKSANRVFARNTSVVDLDSTTCSRFLDENHIQGATTAKIRLGLITDTGDLISVMTFSKPRGFTGYREDAPVGTFELTRFCTKLNTSCVGGASKLFKHFVDHYHPEAVTSFSNLSYASGGIYEQLGFEVASSVAPGYMWVHTRTDVAYNRVRCRKSNLRKLFHDETIDIENQTEDEIMEAHGFVKVYNSGLLKWQRNFT